MIAGRQGAKITPRPSVEYWEKIDIGRWLGVGRSEVVSIHNRVASGGASGEGELTRAGSLCAPVSERGDYYVREARSDGLQ